MGKESKQVGKVGESALGVEEKELECKKDQVWSVSGEHLHLHLHQRASRLLRGSVSSPDCTCSRISVQHLAIPMERSRGLAGMAGRL